MPDFFEIQNKFIEHPELKWVLFGLCMLVVEVFTGTMWMFFVALGALTYGGLISYGTLQGGDILNELVHFLVFTAGWTIVLWYPMKRGFRMSSSKYDNIIGSRAVIGEKGLKKGRTGKVKWSGTVMRARLSDRVPDNVLKAGEEVWVHDLKGSVLIVSPVPASAIDLYTK